MSIEGPAPAETPAMGSGKHKTNSEKKRKRDYTENGHLSKSKKHKKAPESSTSDISKEISPFHIQSSSLYLPLAPVSQKSPLEGICAEHISPLLLTYYPPFRGVLLSYSNPRLSEKPFGNDGDTTLLQNIDEYAVSWAWVTADFLLFKPENGTSLEGYVNLQNEGHLGLVCWNLFNASIERKRLPADWRWVGAEEEERGANGLEMGKVYAEDGAGYFVDGDGVKVDGMVRFRVREIESSHDRERGFLSIEGTMLNEDMEKGLVESEKEKTNGSRHSAGRRLGGSKALGATSLGVTAEPDLTGVDYRIKKHKLKY